MNASDRCDCCGAQAYNLYEHLTKGTELMFCGHHGRRFEPALTAQGFMLTMAEEINPAPDPEELTPA